MSLRDSSVFLGLLVALTCGAAAQEPPQVKWEPYSIETGDGHKIVAELGRIFVPENRRKPGGRKIEIAFVRLKSTAERPGPPIVYLEGGPGGSGINAARGAGLPLLLALREVGDVILLDQRGTGLSQPSLECPGMWDFPLNEPEGGPRARRLAREKIRDCAQMLRKRGVDLAGYNTEASADDVGAVREALGGEKVSLWGVSYGTHLGLAVIRRHGVRVHCAILAGVNGPDAEMFVRPATVEAQIEVVGRLLAADATMSRLLPDFPGLLQRLLAEMEGKTKVVRVEDPQTKQIVEVTVGKSDLQFFTSSAITTTWGIMNLGSLFVPLAKDDWTPLAQRALDRRRAPVGSLMGVLMVCYSGTSTARRKQIEREARSAQLDNAINFLLPEICKGLGNPDLGASFRAPIRSDVPVLLLSGTADGRTPPSNAEDVLRGFPNGQHLVIEGASHGYDLFYFFPGAQRILTGFLKGEPPPTTRIELKTFPFIPPRE